MKLPVGSVRQYKFKNGETAWDVVFTYESEQIRERFETEEEAAECIAKLAEAAERGDPSVAARLAAMFKQKQLKKKRKAAERKEREKKKEKPNFRAPLEFTHKLVLPMSVSHEKMVELVKRLGNADRSQVICATRHITKPPHRVLLLGLRVPRLGSNYVFSVVRGLLGYNVTAEIMRIGERPRVRQPQPTSTPKEEEDAPDLTTNISGGMREKLHALFAKNEQRIREWHAQGLAVREIVARLFPYLVKNSITPHTKELQLHFSHSLRFFKKVSLFRVEMLKRWEDIERWEEEGRSYNWMGSKLGIEGQTFRLQLIAIKENQAANARLQSTTHSDE